MANALSTPACLVSHIETVMSRKTGEREELTVDEAIARLTA